MRTKEREICQNPAAGKLYSGQLTPVQLRSLGAGIAWGKADHCPQVARHFGGEEIYLVIQHQFKILVYADDLNSLRKKRGRDHKLVSSVSKWLHLEMPTNKLLLFEVWEWVEICFKPYKLLL